MSLVYFPRPREREETSPAAGPQSQQETDAGGFKQVGPLLYLFPGYLLLLAGSEFICRYAGPLFPALGPLLYGTVLLLLLLHAALCWDRPFRCLPLTLSLVPVARLLFFWSAVRRLAGLEYLLALGLPLLGIVVAALSLGLPLGSVSVPIRAGAALCRRAWSLLVRNAQGLASRWAGRPGLARRDDPIRRLRVWQQSVWGLLSSSLLVPLRQWGPLRRTAARILPLWRSVLRFVVELAIRLAVCLDAGWGYLRLGVSVFVGPLLRRAGALAVQALPNGPLLRRAGPLRVRQPPHLEARLSAARLWAGTIAPTVRVPRLALVCTGALLLLLTVQAGVRALPGGSVQSSARRAEPAGASIPRPPAGVGAGGLLAQARPAAAERDLPVSPTARPASATLTREGRILAHGVVGLPLRRALSQEQPSSAGRPDTRAASVAEVFPPAPTSVPAPPPPPARPAAVFPAACPGGGYENAYPWGVCTWYAKAKRPDLPWFNGEYGMAYNWGYAARACGFLVDTEPAVGAVIVFSPGANGASPGGHVGYVEEVGPDYVLISECNTSHDSFYAVAPFWWEAGYPCVYRRIPRDRLDPGIEYIHGHVE